LTARRRGDHCTAIKKGCTVQRTVERERAEEAENEQEMMDNEQERLGSEQVWLGSEQERLDSTQLCENEH
jgi:hypothetical protein